MDQIGELRGNSRCIGHEPCPKCASRDNLARYDDGHGYCFGCKYYEPGDSERTDLAAASSKPKDERLLSGEVPEGGLPARKLSEETCRKYGYWIGRWKDRPVQIANYRNPKGELVSQKLRFKTDNGKKGFTQIGDPKKAGLFGQHLWRSGPDSSGRLPKRLVITEGEIDAMSVAQAMGNRWPVVSIRDGATGAAKNIAESIEFVSGFESVVIMFDMDDAGRKAAAEAAAVIPPGKAFIAELPLKDANEMLVSGRSRELVTAAWEARPYRPDGVVSAADVYEQVMKDEEDKGLPFPFDGFTEKLKGMRTSEITTFAFGTGVGKTTLCRQLAYYLHQRGEQVGMLMLEEPVRRSAKHMLGLHMRRRLFLNPATREEMDAAWKDFFREREIYFFEHFGSTAIDNLLNRIRFMATALKCRWIVLDHLSIAVSGLEVGDERKELDVGMTKLRQLVEELGIGLLLVVHLKKPSGDRGFEQGLRPRLHHIRGTQGVAQMSDNVITGAPGKKGTTHIWIEKNRLFGDKHNDDDDPIVLQFDKETGWFSEIPPFDDESEDDDESDERSQEADEDPTGF